MNGVAITGTSAIQTFSYPSEIIMANPSIEQFNAAGAASLDSLRKLINLSLGNLEKLASHNLSSTRNQLLEQVDHAHKLLAAKTPQDALSLIQSHVQPQLDNALAYYRGTYEITAAGQEEYAKLLEHGHAELNKSVSSVLDWYAKSSGNSDFAVSAVKSAITAANSAFENANKTARQVAEITEASVSAASKATSRAVEAANTSRRKAA